MKGRKFREKMFSTETLSQGELDEIARGSEGYDRGEAPVNRNTQSAEDLEDMAQLQKASHGREQMSRTHSYDALDAVRDFGPADSEPEYDYPEPDYAAEPEPDYVPDYAADAVPAPETDPDYLDGEDSDGSEPENNSFALQPLLPNDEKYDDIMDNYEEVIEKMSSNPTKPKYWFKEQGDHWYCTCGQLNKGDSCSNCGLERDLLRALFFLGFSHASALQSSLVLYEIKVSALEQFVFRVVIVVALNGTRTVVELSAVALEAAFFAHHAEFRLGLHFASFGAEVLHLSVEDDVLTQFAVERTVVERSFE
jgi:hypothetical protein